ncbi:MAG: HAD family hydrolase [Caulobacteraceae bacterium]
MEVGGLFVSDVDGTLVTPDKRLTDASLAAAKALADARVPFTLVSSRPPRGMAQVVRAVGVAMPFAAFNGASLVAPDLSLIEALRLPAEVAARALALLETRGIEAFVFARGEWLIRDPAGPKVERERRTVGFDPTVVESFGAVLGDIDKIVAVSDDPGALDLAEADWRGAFAGRATVERSQPYYLDLTHAAANKGEAVARIARRLGVPLARTVVLGDMTNDVAMFRVAGFSIAMGQAPDAVKAAAGAVTDSNTEDGFAKAVRAFVLPRLAPEAAERPAAGA